MLEIKIIASGSSGNGYLIKNGSSKILIDPGINFKKLQKALDFNVTGLDFCLISHEHQDHCLSAVNISKLGVPVFMSRGTADAINLPNYHTKYIRSEKSFTFNNWQVLPFETNHDALEPLGFLIKAPCGSKIMYATDTYFLSYRFAGVTHYLIECNYSHKLLERNVNLPPSVKSRILTSHFELQNVKEFFRHQDLSHTIAIYLLHLSDDNSDRDFFIEEIQKVTGKPVY